MADEEEAGLDLWDQTVMDGVNGDTRMTPDAIFVREYVKTGDALLAVSRAGLGDSRYALSVVAEYHLSRPEIQAAIGIQRELARTEERRIRGYSRDLILDDLEALHQKAKEDGAYAPAISAKKVQAQLLGYLDQTVHVTHSLVPREMTTAELRAKIAELSERDAPMMIEGRYREVRGDSDVSD